MSPAELKRNVEATGSYFFTRKSMKFFGDTMRNFGVRDLGTCWELYRKSPVRYGLNESHYFSKVTFAKVMQP